MTTRRAFLEGTALAAVAVAFAGLPLDGAGRAPQAKAQPATTAELLEAGPLGEKSQGSPDAPVTIIEYASMTCSHCATFHVQTYPLLKARYIDTGKVRYILREFPLDRRARGAAMLARCAGEEKYFDFVDSLFKDQRSWAMAQDPTGPLFSLAREVGFNEQRFMRCLADQKLLDGITEVQRRGQRLGVTSTPTFFINGKLFRGVLTIDQIEREIAPYLKDGTG